MTDHALLVTGKGLVLINGQSPCQIVEKAEALVSQIKAQDLPPDF